MLVLHHQNLRATNVESLTPVNNSIKEKKKKKKTNKALSKHEHTHPAHTHTHTSVHSAL